MSVSRLQDLHALLKLTLEGREDYDRGAKDTTVIAKVLALLE